MGQYKNITGNQQRYHCGGSPIQQLHINLLERSTVMQWGSRQGSAGDTELPLRLLDKAGANPTPRFPANLGVGFIILQWGEIGKKKQLRRKMGHLRQKRENGDFCAIMDYR